MRNGDILPIQIMARREDWQDGISIYMRQRTVGQGDTIALPVVMEKRDPMHTTRVQPMLTLGIHEAQQLIDELWQCGLRPTERTGSAGSLAATERHLADMQKIALGLLQSNLLIKTDQA